MSHVSVPGGRDVPDSRRRTPSSGETLDVPDKVRQRSRSPGAEKRIRSRSPAADASHQRLRSRSPASHHRVPETIPPRSLSPTDLR